MMNELARKRVLHLVYAAWVMRLVPAQTHAASFDCAGAKTAVEKHICGDIVLSALGDALAAVYTQSLATPGSPRTPSGRSRNSG